MKSLEEKIKERNQKREDENIQIVNSVVTITKKSNLAIKNKLISARVNDETYSKFQKICREKGLSTNACLNMLMTSYVRENKEFLND